MQDEGATKFVGVFAATAAPASLKPNPDDFQRIEFATLERILNEIRENRRPFTPTFRHVIGFALPQFETSDG